MIYFGHFFLFITRTYCLQPQNSWIWLVRCSWRESTSPLWRSPRCWLCPGDGRHQQSINQPTGQSEVLFCPSCPLPHQSLAFSALWLAHPPHPPRSLLHLLAGQHGKNLCITRATLATLSNHKYHFLSPTYGLARLRVFHHSLSKLLLPIRQEQTGNAVIQRTVCTDATANDKLSFGTNKMLCFFLHLTAANGLILPETEDWTITSKFHQMHVRCVSALEWQSLCALLLAAAALYFYSVTRRICTHTISIFARCQSSTPQFNREQVGDSESQKQKTNNPVHFQIIIKKKKTPCICHN